MQKIIAFVSSKIFLALLAVVLTGLIIWFVGPLLAFDNIKPFASAGIRVTTIILLLALALFMLTGLPISMVGLVALSVLIWYAGPLLMLGNMQPLGSELSRVVTISLIVFLYLLWGVYRILKIMRQNPEKLDKVFNFRKRNDEEALAAEATKEISGIVNTAVNQLRKMRTGAKGLARVFEGKRFLYELPWYMIIGNPGAGKTTALLNAGLKFPLAEQMGAVALRGQSGGTRNCFWWLTNEAVLIDTAGRYNNHHDGGSDLAHNEAEWKGFLKVLRTERPRAPINGVLASINVADLLGKNTAEQQKIAADLRARLNELRDILGIRFPVYVLITKMDLIAGFEEYFSTLTSEARNQVWGFTLPYGTETGVQKASLKTRCQTEMQLLVERLDAGVNARLIEEFDVDRRRKLVLLAQEVAALSEPLTDIIEAIFMDSRYDNTQDFTTLRGIYFTSAAQSPNELIVDRYTLWQRISRAFTGKTPEAQNTIVGSEICTKNRSYFLHDLLTRLVFTEAHLVRPNLRWEFRFRLIRLIGHVLVGVIFFWLLSAVLLSAKNNHEFLDTVRDRNNKLMANVRDFYAKPSSANVPDLLSEAATLTLFDGLDSAAPSWAWRYGLYSVDEPVIAANTAYAALADRLLLPYVIKRMEAAIDSALAKEDEAAVYAALRVYLQMHDKNAFVAADVRIWATEDWTNTDSASAFGGKAAMLQHLQKMFDGTRLVQSPFTQNIELVTRARSFLDKKPSLTRIYDRLKVDMHAKAPDGVTVASAVGPQAGTVFIRKSGAPLDQGISGLFTYDGYHTLFQKRLPEFLKAAYLDDAWVMGRRSFLTAEQKKSAEIDDKQFESNGSMANEIRRLYLEEYASRWEEFLEDIQALSGATRAFNLQIVRSFAAPDSPLTRLVKAVVRETTLAKKSNDQKSVLDKVASAAESKAQEMQAAFGAKSDSRLERLIVDNRFAALRELAGGIDEDAKGAGLESINGIIDAYYTQLVIADNALSSGAIPPDDGSAAKLRLQAAKLPAPLRGVLQTLVMEGTRGVSNGVGEILATQTESLVGDFCRKAILAKYPFARSEQDVNPEDFVRLFGHGGLFDEFFKKNLQAYVDSSVTPWRYKQESADQPAIAGPDLTAFMRAQKIRDMFFPDPNSRKISWKADIRVLELDPNIVDLTMDMDGQVQRYIHGPVAPWIINWPGPRGGLLAEMIANPRIRQDTSTLSYKGPWALFRLFDAGRAAGTSNAGKTAWTYEFDGRRVVLEIDSGANGNFFNSDLLKNFRCPGRGA